MNDFNDRPQHAPTPEFLASLKRELRRSYRAEQQFEAPRARRFGQLGTVIGLAAGAVVTLTIGLVLGAATGYASAEGLTERQREAATAAATHVATRRQIATMRLEMARADYEALRREVEAGTATRATLQTAKAEVDSMEANITRVEVDLGARGTPTPETPSGLSRLSAPMRNALTALTCVAATAAAQTAPPTADGVRDRVKAALQQLAIPIVGVTPPAARTTSTLGAVLGVRELPDGRLLVNDAGRRQIRVFDATLATATVAQDSVAGTTNSYGERAANIMPYLGDSTLFTEIVSRETVVLDRNGQFVRALAPPMYQAPDLPMAFPFPMPSAIDHKGRLLAESGFTIRSGGIVADSTLIVRADLDSRQVDIVGTRHATKGRNRNDPPENGNRVVTSIIQPVPTEDSWSVLSDGTVAFVRGRDYHVDWILPDGTATATENFRSTGSVSPTKTSSTSSTRRASSWIR